MAYFVKIGAIPQNKSGVGARGYQIFRRGRNVITRWGAVTVAPGRKFPWAYRYQEKIFKFRSVLAAQEELRGLIRIREERDGYSRLPAGAKIMA
jgi:hypothetical protein